ncbi:WXG100 family type VII secretion target [Nocardioides aestuarii]|uniref:ESAT-6-like protein n=1 Tax=Nocardioides aestuarii TaxID=252231 RepID=A0ABW4TS72_9ACTN
MANVNVTYEEMKSQATKLAAGRQEIESKLNELKGQVDNLVAGGFVTDSASAAFQTSYEEFTKGASQTIEGLDGMGQYLTKAAETFQSVDSELASALKG